ncbi:unnamed protein product [Parascedosporium putredinis]|uniref:Uncharacterized protein n=1 Tax=Parascedosporium putredinis TaxID=1442378 RepID=A0A9P1MB32_9PEZI|nr:unnamed protein product [Parascedosporium putredinis]CAI7993884.1 unnamed protein product [Parascedosporium putredinis]
MKIDKRLNAYKEMYHKVQNLEEYPEILPEAKQMLQSLLEQGLLMARYKPQLGDILAIEEFDPAQLHKFVEGRQAEVGQEFESYIQRRKAGGGLELFQTFEEACQYLKNSAAWNFVDGSWLSHIHHVTTPFALRHVTKNAWQIFSEELGDGDLEKITSDAADFIHARHGMNDEPAWRLSIAQLLLSVFPNDFLPEILGFNLYYEAPALSNYRANKEMPEFGISPYYYALHISIDNPDSGHCAMAVGNIVDFMKVVQDTGMMDYNVAWKRVQAGYVLGQTAEDRETVDHYEDKLVEFLCRKANLAEKQPGDNGEKDNQDSDDDSWKEELLLALEDSKPWVYRGDSSKSLLVREVSWKGRMFGAFTNDEVAWMRTWIDSRKKKDSNPAGTYWDLIGGYATVEKAFDPPRRDVAVTHPVFSPMQEWLPSEVSEFTPREPLVKFLSRERVPLDALLRLWFVHPCLLENTISSPYKTTSPLISTCLQLLRAEKGYKPEGTGIACMDEQLRSDYSPDLVALGLEMARLHKLPRPTCLGDLLRAPGEDNLDESTKFAYALLSWAQRPMKNCAFLLGLSRAFLDLEAWVAGTDDLLGWKEKAALQKMVERKRTGFDKCLELLSEEELKCREFVGGYELGRTKIEELLA